MSIGSNQRAEIIGKSIRELFSVYRDAIRRLNIPETEFWIWYTLVAIEGEHTQQDICSRWSLPKQTVNTSITRMRLKKQAYLEAIPGTRNHKVIHLTEAGKKYGEELISPVTKAEGLSGNRISDTELETLLSILGKYTDVLREELSSNEKQ